MVCWAAPSHIAVLFDGEHENKRAAIDGAYKANRADYGEAAKRYDPEKLRDGWNTLPDGEEIYYVGTPALGLWKAD